MLTLILMRHAKSAWDTPQPDHDRPLAPRGQRAAHAMGDWLRASGHVPDAAISSSARRTQETFHGLSLACPVELRRALYHADANTMLRELQTALAPTLLMLGHNPGIADFAEGLLTSAPDHPRFHDYPTCATLVARFDASRWADVGWASGTASDFAIPREIIARQS